jgi:osmotically-inducible protein OsmY
MSLADLRTCVMDSVGERDMSTTKQESVESMARSRLRQSPYLEVRRISCRFHEGVLILWGRVSSYYLKQTAQTLVYRLEGVEELSNRLEVVAPTNDARDALGSGVSTELKKPA